MRPHPPSLPSHTLTPFKTSRVLLPDGGAGARPDKSRSFFLGQAEKGVAAPPKVLQLPASLHDEHQGI